MIDTALHIALGCVALALVLNGWRLLRGPSLGDRIMALDTMVINAIALVILYGIHSGTSVYFELSLLIAMVGFVSTVAYARYLLRGNVIE